MKKLSRYSSNIGYSGNVSNSATSPLPPGLRSAYGPGMYNIAANLSDDVHNFDAVNVGASATAFHKLQSIQQIN